jgi:hypothetical protein
VSLLPGQCEILNISQPYRPSRPVTGIALLYMIKYEADDCEESKVMILVTLVNMLAIIFMLLHSEFIIS